MKLYIIFSTIFYIIFFGLLYRNYIIFNMEYTIEWSFIPTYIFLIILTPKVVLDILLLIFRKNLEYIDKLKKIFYILLFITILIWFFGAPNIKLKMGGEKQVLSEMLKINSLMYKYYDKKNKKLPSLDVVQNITKDVTKVYTPYYKKMEKYRYQVVISEGINPMVFPQKYEKYPPGTIFLVLDKEKQNYYITATILKPGSDKVILFTTPTGPVIMDMQLNLNYIKTTRNRTKGIQKALLKQITDMKKKR